MDMKEEYKGWIKYSEQKPKNGQKCIALAWIGKSWTPVCVEYWNGEWQEQYEGFFLENAFQFWRALPEYPNVQGEKQ